MHFLKLFFVLMLALVASIEGLNFEDLFKNAQQPVFRDANEHDRKPFDLDTVSGIIDSDRPAVHSPTFHIFETNLNGDSEQTMPAGATFDESLGLFNPFNRFGNSNFNLFSFPAAREPWWKGENVCVDREEKLTEPKNHTHTSENSYPAADSEEADHFAPDFNLNIESCSETPFKHTCTTISQLNGRRREVRVTHKCCYGYVRNQDSVTSECQKQDLKSVIETAKAQRGSDFIQSAITNGFKDLLEKNITVFVPTNMAYIEFAEQFTDNNMVDLPHETNESVILNHIVNGWAGVEEFENEQVLTSEFENGKIRINIYPNEPDSADMVNPYKYTVNCAPIVGKTRNYATNGVVTFIDRILMPVTKDLLELIQERSDLSFFSAILKNTDLEKLLTVGAEDKPYTIFAPTDKAFEKLDPQLRRSLKEANGCALNILKNHILDLTFCSTAIAKGLKTTTYNLLNDRIQFERVKDNSSKSEVDDMNNRETILINGQAKVLEQDILATNGALYVIDSLLLTDSGLPITNVMDKHNLTIFRQLVEAANLAETFDGYSNVSFIIPEDKAFEKSEVGYFWAQKLKESPESLKNNNDLKKFLEYHIADGAIMTCNLTETMLHSKTNTDLRVNLYSTLPIFLNTMNVATINCARLLHFDIQSCSSVLHQVDKVLAESTNNLAETLNRKGQTDMFYHMVELANMTELLRNESESFTVFAPINAIFEEVREWYDNIITKPVALKHVINNHIVRGVECCSSFAKSEWPFLRTVTSLNDIQLRTYRSRRPEIQNAGIIKCDTVATNGVIHEINDIITVTPKRREPEHHGHFPRFPIW